MSRILDFDHSIVRIYSQSNQVKGAGFLVSENQILTCAHVVALALNVNSNTAEMPTTEVKLDFPQVAPGEILTAKVIFWLPVNPQAALEDIAVLELTTIPNNTSPVRLMTSEEYWEHKFRAFGFPKGKENGVWANGVLRGGTANGWVQLEDIDNTGYALQEGFSGTPVWDETLEGVVGMAVAAEKQRLDTKAAFIIPTNLLMAAWPKLQERLIASCPYKGLFAFREADAEYFFGREAFTDQLVTAVAQRQFMAVIGPSGSGKSSVVFAGLVPRLRSQQGWLMVDFRPGDRPFYNLAAQLVPLLETQMSETQKLREKKLQAQMLPKQEIDLPDVLRRILEKQNYSRMLLVVDQFEELYTLSSGEVRSGFLDMLLQGLAQMPQLTLVITLRADFLGYALDDRSLADALQGTIPPNHTLKGRSSRSMTYFLGPMNSQELRSVIEMPAQKLGVRLEARLTERILKDVERSPGNLPLLEFALERLWGKQSYGQLTHQSYEEVGGVEKALASYADDVYEKLSEGDKEKAERVFIQLLQPGMGIEDTRKVATRAEVGVDNWDLVRRLADARLVVTGRDETGEETVEVIHEALIREWGMLRGWMAVSREFRVWQEKLKGRLAEWEDKDKDDGALLRGLLLVEAEKWHEERLSELSQEERVFIQLSLELRDRERKQRQRGRQLTVLGLTVGLVLVSGAGPLLELQRQLAEISEKNADMRAKIATLETPFNQSIETQLDAIKLGKELKKLQDDGQLRADIPFKTAGILQKMTEWWEYNRLEGHQDEVYSAEFSPNGKLIATASADNTVKLWKPDGTLVKTLEGHQDAVYSAEFSPNGKLIATASADNTVKLWKPDGTLVRTLEGHQGTVISAEFSPDGELIATASWDKIVKLWKRDGTLVKTLEGHQDEIYSAEFSPDGELIATASNDGTVKLWKRDGTLVRTLEGHQDGVSTAKFSPDGELIATTSADDTVKLWKRDGTLVKTLEGHQEGVSSAEFSPDGNLIATASGKTGKLWKRDGTLVRTLEGHQDAVYSAEFSLDGNLIATQSEKTVKLWKRDGTLVRTLEGHQDVVYSA
ncbi:MAG: AAA family ATPase, partial [Okeania sp. SIO1H6]|nr:AAA family ATPase [Okeania sp. SIO1H6]